MSDWFKRYQRERMRLRGSWQTQPPHRKKLQEKSLMWLRLWFAIECVD